MLGIGSLRWDAGRPALLPRPRSSSHPDAERAVITGRFEEDEIIVRLRRVDESKFLLVSRGFRWISEEAFNR